MVYATVPSSDQIGNGLYGLYGLYCLYPPGIKHGWLHNPLFLNEFPIKNDIDRGFSILFSHDFPSYKLPFFMGNVAIKTLICGGFPNDFPILPSGYLT